MALPATGQSLLAQQILDQNFCPQLSAILAVGAASASITFTPVTGRNRQTFKITNKGDNGAYIAWGYGSATAVASSATPAVNCDYVAAGAILTQDFQVAAGPVNTIAAIQDGGATNLEISIGFGQ
ncbi:MAG: hypothetical protein WC100_01660 [Sterolibacterium sp.]